MFELHEKPCDSIEDLIDNDFKFVKNNQKIEYLNVASAFDIETTSFEINDEKLGIMYAWTLNINGKHILRRTWKDFLDALDYLSNIFCLNKEKRIIIYVHNLSFEFQWFRKWIKWESVFMLDNRKICYALTKNGIEFRCSYILSGYALKNLYKQCTKYKIEKLVGDLDYSKIRHSDTPLSEKEKQYIYNDGLCVVAYIQELIEKENNNISNIPLTKTGFVRRYVRNQCLYDDVSHSKSHKYLAYRKMIKPLTIDSYDDYVQIKNAYLGAHTHANPNCINTLIKNVYSLDFTSSYPYVMLSERGFPMSHFKKYNIKDKNDFYDKINNYCCIFDVTFYNIESTKNFEHLIPISRCLYKLNEMCDNGKLVKADIISMSLNEIDFLNFSRFYKWEKMGIKHFNYALKGYLPKDIILSILKFYNLKTTLKGVKGMEDDYLKGKENLNSIYGMCVTDICKDELIYNDNNEYEKNICDYEKVINKYNKSKNRFLSYYWGMYVTSFAKYNLCDGILELKDDYLYSDTDSVKCINYFEHIKFFEEYNKNVKIKLLKMLKFYHLNPELIEPKNSQGEKKLIGIWDKEFEDDKPSYLKFKTLGSKRYFYQYPNGDYSFTISGLNKEIAIPYLIDKAKKKKCDVIDLFNDNMYVPKGKTGKNLHTYFDYEIIGEIIDYLGNKSIYHELSGVNLSEIDFTLSLSDNFIEYLLGLRGVL